MDPVILLLVSEFNRRFVLFVNYLLDTEVTQILHLHVGTTPHKLAEDGK